MNMSTRKNFSDAWRKKIKESNEYRMAVVDTDFIDLVNDATVIEDVVEVVRCKNCIWFVPKFVLTNDGERRPCTEEEKNLPFGVLGNVGINCGSRCERYSEWEENRVPVFVQENDFCSYGERKAGNEKGAVNGSKKVPGENRED